MAENSSGSAPSCASKRMPIYLNVYDLTPMNGYVYWVGLGIFHSGLEAHGTEYAFGAHDFATSGVFEVEPRRCPGFIYRNSILLGYTDMAAQEFRTFIEHLADDYNGDTYNLIVKNCNHFSSDVCHRLTGKDIPAWVNRLARMGWFCNCLLPESLQVTTVTDSAESDDCEANEKRQGSSTSKEMIENENDDHHLLMPHNGDSEGLIRAYL